MDIFYWFFLVWDIWLNFQFVFVLLTSIFFLFQVRTAYGDFVFKRKFILLKLYFGFLCFSDTSRHDNWKFPFWDLSYKNVLHLWFLYTFLSFCLLIFFAPSFFLCFVLSMKYQIQIRNISNSLKSWNVRHKRKNMYEWPF